MIADNIKQALRRQPHGETFVLLAADLASNDTYMGFFLAQVRFINDELIPAGQGYGHVAVVISDDRHEGEAVRYWPTRTPGIYMSEDGRRIVLHERVAL